MRFKLFLIMLVLILNSSALAINFYSGNQYKFGDNYNENYICHWDASSGSYQEIDKNTAVWIAPDVNSPTEVALYVSVTDKACGCHSNYNKIITVLPREEIKLEIEATSNSTNSTSINPAQINDSTEQLPNLANNTEDLKVEMPIGNDTLLDPVSESPENITEPVNLTSDALALSLPEKSPEQNKSDPDANQYDKPTAAETPSQVDPSYPVADLADNPLGTESDNIISDVSTLSFSDGTKVDVVFAESSSGSDTAYVILHEDDEELSESSSGTDGSGSVASLVNIIDISESATNQTDQKVNQTKTTNMIPKSPESTDAQLKSPESSDAKEDPPDSGDQSIAEAALSDAAASPPGQAEAQPEPAPEPTAV
ncbi:MAG: hypothetical protein NTY37_12705 [Methanothrix sp.]|nr:hypothetical protein [Methanothrix sp.]